MLRKDDVVYYKVELQKLFNQAEHNGLDIELGMKEVSFINNISKERASANPIQTESKVIDTRRQIKLLKGEIQTFWIKGERNPCGCGSNCYHKENDKLNTYGVCNACDLDIYCFNEKEEFKEWEYKK